MVVRELVSNIFVGPYMGFRYFPASVRHTIAQAVSAVERSHGGEICVAIEASRPLIPLLRGVGTVERARELFSSLGVWDTEGNNGVLLYIGLGSRCIELVADRGIMKFVSTSEIQSICDSIEASFRARNFEQGVIKGIQAIGALLGTHFSPRPGDGSGEISDQPVVV